LRKLSVSIKKFNTSLSSETKKDFEWDKISQVKSMESFLFTMRKNFELKNIIPKNMPFFVLTNQSKQ